MKNLFRIFAIALVGAVAMGMVACNNEGDNADITVSPLLLQFEAEGGSQPVSINGTDWSATANQAWIEVAEIAGGINVSVGTTTQAREGTVSVIAPAGTKVITVRQNAPGEITVDPESLEFTAEGDTKTVNVTGVDWSATPSDGWITIVTADGSFTVTVGTVTEGRSGTVTVSNSTDTKTVAITQRGPVGSEYDIETVYIPAGTFQMGSPTSEPNRPFANENQFWASFSQGFYMSKYEITNAQYAVFLNAKQLQSEAVNHPNYGAMEAAICNWGDNNGKVLAFNSGTGSYAGIDTIDRGVRWDGEWIPATGYENYPVIWVTYYGAIEYAKWVGGNIPSEAQWEYACRGGESESLPFGIGTGRKLVAGMANFNVTVPYDLDNSGQPGSHNDGSQTRVYSTTPVGNYDYTNGYGLYDMHGNVLEWCLDMWRGSANYPTDTTESNPAVDYLVTNDTSSGGDPSYIVRGGSWMEDGRNCRSASRTFTYPGEGNFNLGFRVVFAG